MGGDDGRCLVPHRKYFCIWCVWDSESTHNLIAKTCLSKEVHEINGWKHFLHHNKHVYDVGARTRRLSESTCNCILQFSELRKHRNPACREREKEREIRCKRADVRMVLPALLRALLCGVFKPPKLRDQMPACDLNPSSCRYKPTKQVDSGGKLCAH